jgi:hypothetical protein
MSKVTLNDVRNKCTDGRFFPYDHWLDRTFVPPAIILTWVFVRLGVSGNTVSWISGIFVILGACGLASNDAYIIIAGSFGYMVFYLLDYVDGGVARYNGTAGMSGQYVDWVIHIIASVSTMAGLVAGAFLSTGAWIFPFGILALVAAALTTGRFSMGWFAVCMERQQRRAKGSDLALAPTFVYSSHPPSRAYWAIKSATTLLFHENYIIFSLPLLAFCQLFVPNYFPDFRTGLVVLAGTFYFAVMILEIQRIASSRGIEEAYRKLFIDDAKPDLPKDHFFH